MIFFQDQWTFNQPLGASLKNTLFATIFLIFHYFTSLFFFFYAFHAKSGKKYFNQHLVLAVLKHWSKYKTIQF